MKIHQVTQGSPEWHALRATTRNASEAPAMMGVSAYKSRSALIREKATGIAEEITPEMQRRFDLGHMTEALARPLVVSIIGEDLYPLVATDDLEYLLASSDGATMIGDIGFEHKLWNEEIAALVKSGEVPESHKWQLDQQIAVFGFEKIIFVCSDGTPERLVYCWYSTTPERIERLMAGWSQFEQDVADYVPSEVVEKPKADVTIDLPALFVHAKGEITTHNMEAFGAALAVKLAETRAIVLVTDQDFSNAKEAAKKFRETAKAIALSKDQMLAQTETIGEAANKMDAWAADLNATALQLEKDVKREDLAKKEVMILTAKDKYTEYVAGLEAEIKPIRLGVIAPVFADAIKGKSKYGSMQDAIDSMLSSAKTDAEIQAKDVRAKLLWLKENAAGRSALFPDLQQIIFKPMDDLTLIITSRIEKATADENARLEAERQKIRAEEQAKASAEAQEAAQAAAAKAEAERLSAEAGLRAIASTIPNDSQPAINESEGTAQITAQAEVMQINPCGPKVSIPLTSGIKETGSSACLSTIKLGEICTRLGFTVSAEFLASLGFEATTDKNAKLYPLAKFPTICRCIADHALSVALKQAA